MNILLVNCSTINILILILVFTQAYKRGLFGPQYVWITYSWYPERWWTQAVTKNNVGCTDEELEEFVIGGRMLTLSHFATQEDRSKTTDQNIVSC